MDPSCLTDALQGAAKLVKEKNTGLKFIYSKSKEPKMYLLILYINNSFDEYLCDLVTSVNISLKITYT